MYQLLISLFMIFCSLLFLYDCQKPIPYKSGELKDLCDTINKTDFKVKDMYHLLPKRKGDKLLRYLHLYNEALSNLTKHIVGNNSIMEKECLYVLRPGAARFFYALYDDELLQYFFKWTPPYTKNKGKYEEMLDYRVHALNLWDQLHDYYVECSPFIGKLSSVGNAVRNIGASLFNKLAGGKVPPLPPQVSEGDVIQQLEFMNKMLRQVRGFIMSPSPLIREKMRPYTQTLIDQIIPQFEQLQFSNDELKSTYKMRPEDIIKFRSLMADTLNELKIMSSDIVKEPQKNC